MLRIVEVALRLIGPGMKIAEEIGRHDRNHAEQLRQSLPSVVLNLAEGSGSRGGNRTLRYANAGASARESWANVRVAQEAGWVRAVDPRFLADLNHVTAVCVKLTRGK